MKKLFLFTLLLLLTNCFGYKPIFLTTDHNYNINDIKILSQNKVTNQIVRKLKSFKYNDNKENVSIEISSTNEERVLSKDNAGDPIIFETNIVVDIKILFENQDDKSFQFKESFTYNNQSTKFDLKLYKDNIQKNVTEKIIKEIILKIRSLQ